MGRPGDCGDGRVVVRDERTADRRIVAILSSLSSWQMVVCGGWSAHIATTPPSYTTRQHYTAAIFLHPPTIASTSSSSSCCNATPKGRQNRRPGPLSLREHGRPTCAMPGSDQTRLLFAQPMGEGGPAHRAPASGTLKVRGNRRGGGALSQVNITIKNCNY